MNYSSGAVALGEGTYGAWAGAGTDRGVSLAVFDLSHGVSPMFWLPRLGPLFAGAHLVATLMPINSETWSDVTNDLWDGAGASYVTWQAICNYNVAQYPWSL